MEHVEIKGIIPPIITPMHEDESVNYEELRNQTERLIESGVHGIFALGTNGEGYILTRDEKKKVLETVIDQVNGRIPVYAGTGCISTRETVELSREAKAIGADVLSVITPSFAAAGQEELYIHYETLAMSVDLPIVMYNIPARTGNALERSTVERLAKIENIVGIKDSSGDYDNMLEYISAGRGENFSVLSGNDSLIIRNLLAGGTGGIAGCANVFPKTMVSIYELFVEGNTEKAKAVNESIGEFRACFKYGNPNTIVKLAVSMLGYNVGNCRAPFNLVSPEGKTAIKRVLEVCKEKGMC